MTKIIFGKSYIYYSQAYRTHWVWKCLSADIKQDRAVFDIIMLNFIVHNAQEFLSSSRIKEFKELNKLRRLLYE